MAESAGRFREFDGAVERVANVGWTEKKGSVFFECLAMFGFCLALFGQRM